MTTLRPRSWRTMRVPDLGEHALLHIASGIAPLVTVLVLIGFGVRP